MLERVARGKEQAGEMIVRGRAQRYLGTPYVEGIPTGGCHV